MGTPVIKLLSLFVTKQIVVSKTKGVDVLTFHSSIVNAAADDQCEQNGSPNRTNNVLPLLFRPSSFNYQRKVLLTLSFQNKVANA